MVKINDLLSVLYDMQLSDTGIEFILLGKMTLAKFEFRDIERLEPVGFWGLGVIVKGAYNMSNRLGNQDMLLVLKNGWFSRRIVVTPKNPAMFCKILAANGVAVDKSFLGEG